MALRQSQEQEAARQRRVREEEEEILRQVLELSLREKEREERGNVIIMI